MIYLMRDCLHAVFSSFVVFFLFFKKKTKKKLALSKSLILRPVQTDATLLGPTCCVRLHGSTTMLALVGTCCVQFETNISIVLLPAERSATNVAPVFT